MRQKEPKWSPDRLIKSIFKLISSESTKRWQSKQGHMSRGTRQSGRSGTGSRSKHVNILQQNKNMGKCMASWFYSLKDHWGHDRQVSLCVDVWGGVCHRHLAIKKLIQGEDGNRWRGWGVYWGKYGSPVFASPLSTGGKATSDVCKWYTW